MPAVARHLLALALLWGAARAATPCDARVGCAACLGAATPDAPSPCKWCYSAGKCTPNEPDVESCPTYATHPEVCPCEPAKQDECHTCVSKLGCVWVEAGKMDITSKLPGAFSVARARNWDGVCWSGSMLTGPRHVTDVVSPSEGYKVVTTRIADAWYWGQCGLKNQSFVWTLFIMFAGTLAMGAVFCLTTQGAASERAPALGAIQF